MRRHILLFLILLLASVLRLTALGRTPSGFTPDEASQGYTAYSLLKTGRDEWRISWPLTSFRAFADYRAPLQTYLIIPSIAIFGLNEFAVRLPSAIFGILAVLAVYLLANELFPKSQISNIKYKITIGHLAALFLSVSPWAIQFSRMALEANFGSFLFPLGLFLLIRGNSKNNRIMLLLSATVLGISLYSYLAAKLFVLLFLVCFFFLNRHLSLSFISVFIIIATPIYINTFFGPGNIRGKDLIITNFTKENLESISREQYYSSLNHLSPILTRFFSNKLTFTFRQFIGNYTSYLSPTFWFTEGGREITYSIFPGEGLLHLWMAPLIIFGFYQLFSKRDKRLSVLLIWLILAIIPAAVTKDGYRPNRVGSLLAFWEIVAAYGYCNLFTNLSFAKRQLLTLFAVLWVSVSMIFYLNLYFFVAPVRYPSALSYGYRNLVKKINLHADKYETIIIDKGNQSQVFIAFYDQMDPGIFQRYAIDWWPQIQSKNLLFLDMLDPYKLDKYVFKSFDPSSDIKSGNLVIIRSEKMNQGLEKYILDKVDFIDGNTAFYLLSYDQE